MTTMKMLRIVALPLVVILLATADLGGQETASRLATQSLKPYWHVFIAYAIAWVLVFGWLIAMARRLRRVEERLGKG